jgi:hypothetical protein
MVLHRHTLRSKYHGPYGASPFKLEYGYDMPLPSAHDVPAMPIDEPTVEGIQKLHAMAERNRDAAAKLSKKEFDSGRIDAPIEPGDWIWLAVPNAPKMKPKKTGPFLVGAKHGELDVVVEELPNGPPLANRHQVVNVRNVEKYEQEPMQQEEATVRAILEHRFKKRKRRGKPAKPVVEYLVRWADGDETWQRKHTMIDQDANGVETVTDALTRYWQRHPELLEKEGRG